MSFNLKKNNPVTVAEAGFEFVVELPDGTKTDAKIKVRGRNSKKVTDFIRLTISQEESRKASAKRRSNGKDSEDMTLEQAEDFSIRNAASRIISWSGFTDGEDDEVLVFSTDAAETLMREHLYIRSQVLEVSDEILNFRHKVG